MNTLAQMTAFDARLSLARKQGRPLITAHTGCMDTIPNSMESVVAAFRSPADIVEVDIRVTADGIPILLHDGDLSSRALVSMPVKSLSWDEVSRINGLVISLERFLETISEMEGSSVLDRQKLINLDIKDTDALLTAHAVVRRFKMESRVVYSGLEQEGVVFAEKFLEKRQYLLNIQNGFRTDSDSQDQLDAFCEFARTCGCAGINLEWIHASSDVVKRIHAWGLSALLWTVDRDEDMKVVLSYGADSITTNFPDRLALLVRARDGTRDVARERSQGL